MECVVELDDDLAVVAIGTDFSKAANVVVRLQIWSHIVHCRLRSTPVRTPINAFLPLRLVFCTMPLVATLSSSAGCSPPRALSLSIVAFVLYSSCSTYLWRMSFHWRCTVISCNLESGSWRHIRLC